MKFQPIGVFINKMQAPPEISPAQYGERQRPESPAARRRRARILGRWYSTARVSKRPSHKSAACLRARYCTNLTGSDLNKCQKNLVNALFSALLTKFFDFFITFEGEGSAVPALAGLAWIPNTAGRKPVL